MTEKEKRKKELAEIKAERAQAKMQQSSGVQDTSTRERRDYSPQYSMWNQVQARTTQLNQRNAQIEQAQKQQQQQVQQTQQTQTISPSTNVNMLNNLSSAGVGKTNLSQTRVQQTTEKAQLPINKKIGQFGKGNIDLTNRPKVVNEDGSVSTVRSMSFYDDKEKTEVLIPTVVNGKIVSDKEAIQHYYDTGEYLGKFKNAHDADKYAIQLHFDQERQLDENKNKLPEVKETSKKEQKQMQKDFREAQQSEYEYNKQEKEAEYQEQQAEATSLFEAGTNAVIHAGSQLAQKPKALYDGYNFGDVTGIGASTLVGAGAHYVEGGLSTVGSLLKAGAYGLAGVGDTVGTIAGNEWLVDKSNKLVEKSKSIERGAQEAVQNLNDLFDKNSILGDTGNKALESIGQSKTIQLAGGLGKRAQDILTYGMGAGEGISEAYEHENTKGWEALLKGHLGGTTSLFSENMFENPISEYGGTKLTKGMQKAFGEKFVEGLSRGLAKLGFSAIGEGIEEITEAVLNKKFVNKLINTLLGEEKYETDIDANDIEDVFLATISTFGGGAPATIKQLRVNRVIRNSNLNNTQKEGLTKIAQENNLEEQDVKNIIEDTLGTENAQVKEKQPTTMENKPISENEQQTTQAEQKEAKIKSSGDIEQDAESINQELSKTLNMMKDLDKYFKDNDIDSKNVKRILKSNGIESTQQLDNLIESQENAIKTDQKAIQDSKEIKKAKKASGEEISELDKNALKRRKESLKADTERLETLKSVKERVEKSEVRANKKMLNEEKAKLLEKRQPAKLPEKQTNVVDENTVEKNVKEILKDNGFSSEAPLNMAIEKQEQLKAKNEEKLKNSDSEGYKEYYQKEIAKIDKRLNEYKKVKRQIDETRSQPTTQEQTTQLDETGLNSAQFKEQAKEYNELQKQENELEKIPPKPKKEYVKELNKEQQEKRNAVLKRIGITEEQWNKTDADTKEIIYDIDEVTDEEKKLLNKKIETEDSLKATKGWEDLSKTIETKNSKIQNKLVELNKKMRDTITKEFADIKVTDKLGEKTNRKEFEGFDITKSSLNKEEYLDKDKAKKDGYNYVEIVEMSPEEYLASCAKNEGVGIDEVLAGIDRPQNIVNYAERMLNGEKAPMPYLDLKTHGQEGRHRALSAKLAGIDKIPVLILSDKDFSNRVSQLNETQNNENNIKENVEEIKEEADDKSFTLDEDLEEEANQMDDEEVAEILSKPAKNTSKKARAMAVLSRELIDKGMIFENMDMKNKDARSRTLQSSYQNLLNSSSQSNYAIMYGHEGSKSLLDIRNSVKEEDLQDFYKYAYHLLNIDRMSLKANARKELEVVREQIRDKQSQLKKAVEETQKAVLKEDLKKLNKEADRLSSVKDKPVFSKKITAEMSREIASELEKNHPYFKDTIQDIYDYLDANMKLMVKNGVVSQDSADYFKKIYEHYVPINRVYDKGKAINVPLFSDKTGVLNPIRKAKGGTENIRPLFETIADRTNQVYTAINRNDLGNKLYDALGNMNQLVTDEEAISELNELVEKEGTFGTIEDVLEKTGKDLPSLTIFKNGKRVKFKINNDIYNALKPQNELYREVSSTAPAKALQKFGSFRRGLITEYNPLFIITNGVKDVQDVLMNSQHTLKTYATFPEATAQILLNGKWFKEYQQNGGYNETLFQDGEFKNIEAKIKKKNLARKIIGFPLDAIAVANRTIELLPRVSEYIASRKDGRSIQTSMLDSARVTTNFKAGGETTKFLNKNGFTFLNANVQGLVQQARNIREANAKGLKGWTNLAIKTTIAGLPALFFNGLLWKDDDEYEELSDYVKDNYYIVAKIPYDLRNFFGGNNFIKLPKGRAVSAVQKVVSNVGEYLTNDKKINLDNVTKDFWEDIKFAWDAVGIADPRKKQYSSTYCSSSN